MIAEVEIDERDEEQEPADGVAQEAVDLERVRKPGGGVSTTYVDLASGMDALWEALSERTSVVWFETPTNPLLNMIDIHAQRPLPEHPVYSTAKAGLMMLTRSLARELAPEVRVNGIAPGPILWPEGGLAPGLQEEIIDKTLLKRSGSPEDIVRTALFFARDATYVTGQILAVDGGRSVGRRGLRVAEVPHQRNGQEQRRSLEGEHCVTGDGGRGTRTEP